MPRLYRLSTLTASRRRWRFPLDPLVASGRCSSEVTLLSGSRGVEESDVREVLMDDRGSLSVRVMRLTSLFLREGPM